MTGNMRLYVVAIILHFGVSVCLAAGGGRVLHFPADRSLGNIKVMEVDMNRRIQLSHHTDSVGWRDWGDWMTADNFSEAQGDVVIPAGKKAALFLNEKALKNLSPLLNLKPDDLFMLTNIMPNWNTNIVVSNDGMKHISHLTGLKILWFNNVMAANESMQHITKMRSLEMLRPPKGLTNRGLFYIARMGSLKRLYLQESRVSNVGVNRCLPKLTELEELSLFCPSVNDEGLEFLKDMPKLVYLSLRSGNFTDAGMVHVRKCPPLRIIDLMYLPITDAGIKNLTGHPGMENIRLNYTEVTDRGLGYLKTMPNLKKLTIEKRGPQDLITDTGMMHLAQIDSLEHLRLPNFGITEQGLSHVTRLKNLKYLWVGGNSNNPFTDTALRHVSKLRSLEFLLIKGTGFTDAGMDDLAKLADLRTLNLQADLVTNEGLAKLKSLQSLERLDLTCKNVTISGLSHLNALNNLTDLEANYFQQDNSGLDISGLTRLEGLKLSTWHKSPGVITDADLACLAGLKRLKKFVIQSSVEDCKMDITGQGLKHLAGLTELQNLCLGGPNLKDEDFKHFANMKKLLSLYIYGGNLTDECLKHLEALPQLRSLKIYMENDITDEALARLDKRLPNLRTIEIRRDEKKNNPKKKG